MATRTAVPILAAAALAQACASSYRRPEPIADKMARYRPRARSSVRVPRVPALPEAPAARAAAGRGPASGDGAPAGTAGTARSPGPDKRLYFLALHGQYRRFARLPGGEGLPGVGPCPRFHSELVGDRKSVV